MPYNNQPWEVHADMVAGIYRFREHTIEGIAMGLLYFDHIRDASLSSLIGNRQDFSNHNFSAIKEGHL